MNAAGGGPRLGLWERIARVLFSLFPPSYRERHAASRQALTEQLLESEPDPGRRSRLARGVAFDALRTLPLAWLRASVSTVGDDGGIPSLSLLDWKLGFRMLIKDPGLSLIGGFALACVIGGGAGLIHVAQQLWFSDMGLDEGRQIVRLERLGLNEGTIAPIPVEEFVAWREKLSEIVDLSGWRMSERALFVRAGESGAMTESPIVVAEVTASTFPLTRMRPLRGRVLTEADEGAGAPPVIVVGYEMWQNRLGADPNIVGREVQLGEQSVTVVGVMPQGFAFPWGAHAWTPLHLSEMGPGGSLQSFGRLAPSASLESAQAELQVVGAQTAAERSRRSGPLVTPRTGDSPQAPSEARVRRFAGRSPTSTNLLATYSAVLVFILCMTAVCANVATLQFARTAKRESEIVVRNALGASRGRIAGQLFVEALVLSLVSAAVGLVGVQVLIRQLGGPLRDLLPPLPFWWSETLEIETVLAAAGLAVLAAAMVAVLPAIRATGEGMNEALKSRAAGGASLRFGGVWSVIIVCQVAITVMCLPFGVGFAHEEWRRHVARESFPAERYLSFLLFYPRPGQDRPDPSDRVALYEELARRLAMEPGFEGITYGSELAGMDHRFISDLSDLEIEPVVTGDSQDFRGADPTLQLRVASVDVHYFETFELSVVAGQAFEAADVGASNHPILINESFARFLGGRPLGTRFRFPSNPLARDYFNVSGDEPLPWLEVVGVVRNVGTDANTRRPRGGMETEDQIIYRPSSAALGGSLWVAVKTIDPNAFAPRLRAVAAQLGPGVRLANVAPLDVELRQRKADVYFAAFASAGGVLLCILLSAAGLTAVMTVTVAARTREVGIRLAIGASKRAVCATLFGRAVGQLVLGSVIGSGLFVLVETQIIPLQGPLLEPLFTVAWVMILVGLIACAIPAQHALRIHPLDAIRE